ncbi:tyrosine-protein kinase HTK16-like [Pollicipes pollicipes]|uniref:tyrosine-protein kinase HTK16-like n=1 Tax=Pollicipes pollicipes TaxID=41117 RepID=UPI001884F85D|nr:tyrosine-protein kinase HTK16-like [Pollicipes pollicipes]
MSACPDGAPRLTEQPQAVRGEFGKVYQGRWLDPRGNHVDVAIKTHLEASSGVDRDQLIREAELMKDLRHPCIVRFLGLIEHEPLMMVRARGPSWRCRSSYPLGALLDFLQDQPHDVSLDTDLKLWAGQVAAGMDYLEHQRLVHRDLAARNILLASRTQAKISDFGFSRHLAGDRDYYQSSQGGRWPIKWYAPEAINFGTFSAASDVWSFGVLLWEMYSYGEQPYGDLPGVQAFLEIVELGQRLEKPEYCPGGIYEVMLKCWAYDAKERPSFCALHKFFDSDNEYRNLSDLATPQVVTLTAAPPSPPAEEVEPELESAARPSASDIYDVLSAARSEAPPPDSSLAPRPPPLAPYSLVGGGPLGPYSHLAGWPPAEALAALSETYAVPADI